MLKSLIFVKHFPIPKTFPDQPNAKPKSNGTETKTVNDKICNLCIVHSQVAFESKKKMLNGLNSPNSPSSIGGI